MLDVGANTGQFGAMLRRAGYTGRVVSIEPLSHLHKELEERSETDPNSTS